MKGIVLLHCAGGVSRSAAAAAICMCVWLGPGRETECVAEVLRVRPGALPNQGLIQFADAILQRNGRLVEAVLAARSV